MSRLHDGGRLAPPNVDRFAPLLADVAADLRLGRCVLVECDKGWTPPFVRDIGERLGAFRVRCDVADGRPRVDPGSDDVGVMLVSLVQLRRFVRCPADGDRVIVLPHLDVMAARDGGWNPTSREVVPLLFEDPAAVVLGFGDPTLPLLPVAGKLFHRRYEVPGRWRTEPPPPPPPPPPPS